MIYFFHGSDVGRVRAKAFAWIAASRQKAPEAPYLRLQEEQITETSLRNAISAQGLFFAKSLVLIDDPFSNEESGEMVLSLLPELAASENPIALLAPRLPAVRAKKIESLAVKTYTEDAGPKKERGFNSPLVTALGSKDGPLLWKELIRALRLGDAPELVHGLLHWKARDMMQKGSVAWGREGARNLSLALIELLSDARGGDLPLAQALERFALSIRK